jgi:hypothetical protein
MNKGVKKSITTYNTSLHRLNKIFFMIKLYIDLTVWKCPKFREKLKSEYLEIDSWCSLLMLRCGGGGVDASLRTGPFTLQSCGVLMFGPPPSPAPPPLHPPTFTALSPDIASHPWQSQNNDGVWHRPPSPPPVLVFSVAFIIVSCFVQ